MPHLVRWHEELGDGGLAVVGLHVQNATADAVKAKAKSLGVRFAVTAGGSVDGVKGGGIPHCVLFDHTGKMVFDGHPTKAEAKLREAFADMLADEAGGKPGKAVTAALEAFKKGGTTGDLLRKMTSLRDGSDGASAKEAKAVVAKLQSGAQARLDEAKKEQKDDPVAAYDAASSVAGKWKGTAIGKEAAELTARLKENKEVVAELKARPVLEKIRATEAAIMSAAKGKEPDTAEFKKAFAPQLKQLDQTITSLKKAAPGAPSTLEAEEVGKRLGVGSK
jgi:hypothetical protein